jgi:adenylosuccinate synthase
MTMAVTAVIGAQWGDEAKGKIVDLLSAEAEIVARFNGGDNAGHTVVNPYGTFKLRLTPNGFSNPKTICAIGAGVVLNLKTLLDEIDMIQGRGIELMSRLWISPRCSVIMPYHPLVEGIYEEVKGGGATGTTGRGIGPVYADKVSYNSLRLSDFTDETVLAEKLRIQLGVKNNLFQSFGMEALDLDALMREKLAQFERLRPAIREPFGIVQAALSRDAAILLEGAQGSLLDNDWGTYPFCTASTTVAGGASAGLGNAPRWITGVIGVAKAYITRVGAGPMPTELLDATGEALRKAGAEFGTVTGRPRRCGWLDAELLRFTAQLNGFTGLALTKLDVLDELPIIRICVGYRLEADASGDLHHYWEGDARWLAKVEPVYIEVEGWRQPTRGLQVFGELPKAAQAYMRKVEELVGVPVKYISTGPGREETIRLD